MKTFSPPDDDELLFDVIEEVNLLCEECATTLILLGHDPANRDLLDKLFRSVHSIKGDIGIAQMSPLLPLLTAIEDILGMMREGELQYDSLISDLLLTIFEHVKSFAEDCADYKCAKYDPVVFASATELISMVRPGNIEQHEALLTKSLLILDPSLALDDESSAVSQQYDELNINWADEVEPDLVFFQSIMKPVEERLDNWQGRSSRQLKMALLLNHFAGNPVDKQQLTAAVYLHDVGMALLPLAILRKQTPLVESEIDRLRGHVQRGFNFLSEMPHWSQARQFILEHHERADGQGYPQGLKNEEISAGAKILALVDAFEAMTHERAQKTHRKRPIANAMQEINLAKNKQFCPYWVKVFNEVMASILAK